MSTFRNRFQENESDAQVAEGAARHRSLYCCADGCNALWSVEGPMGKCCSAHAWKPKNQWKGITRMVNDTITERAAMTPEERERDAVRLEWKDNALSMAVAQLLKQEDGGSMKMFSGSKAWAYALKRCDEAGMKLTPTQREMYQAVVARETIA